MTMTMTAIPRILTAPASALSPLLSHPILAGQATRRLIRAAQRGANQTARMEARDELIRCNVRLVAAIAKSYVPRCHSLTIEDLIGHGIIGLCRAIEDFDLARKHDGEPIAFSTYAARWVHQKIGAALRNQDALVRVPVHLHKIVKGVRQGKRHEDILGHEPTEEQRWALADALAVLDAERIHGMPSEVFADVAARTPDPSDDAEARDEIAAVLSAVARLPIREAEVIRLRFDLDGGGRRTLAEVGLLTRVTKERVRQIETAALQRLREMVAGIGGAS